MSYKIVDQIKKSPLPRPLKTVLESYATFGNKDGTSVRPTQAAVASRASASRSTINTHAQTLVALGLLVHDRDEHGIFLKHGYGNGVWAYVYHIDASKLIDPDLIARWEAERKEFTDKCRKAGAKNLTSRWAKGTSGNRSGLSKLEQQEQRDSRQTRPEGFSTNLPEGFSTKGTRGILDTDPTLVPGPADPSAASAAVHQNQSTNQLINPTEATPPTEETFKTPLDLFSQGILWDFETLEEREMSPLEKQAWTKKQISDCWWEYRDPTAQDLRFMYEALQVLHTRHLLPTEVIAYAQQHFDPEFGGKQKTSGMVIRDCCGLWKAVCGPKVSQTNGLVAQFNNCMLKPCKACSFKRVDETRAWVNPNLQKHARHPVAPPPPPKLTCGDCGATYTDSRLKYCVECQQKKSDAAFLRLFLEGRLTADSDRAVYDRLVKAGKIMQEQPAPASYHD
jgi:hypothetical protein